MKIINNINFEHLSELIIANNIIGIFQGRSEAGPRSLGNRSFILNPMHLENKDKMNVFKKRELFRPLAATVLKEHSKEWFEMLGIEESPFMTYSFKIKENKKNVIPAVVHVDGTCRIQTISEEQNKNFYNIIKEFYKKTNVPMLLNTSFNIAGEPLVESPEDALHTFKNSDLPYLYFPELMVLLKK